MSREWANEIADKFASGELIWAQGAMVGNTIAGEGEPAFCMLGAIALDCGGVVDRRVNCGCGDVSCNYGNYKFKDWTFRQTDCFINRVKDLGDWIRSGWDENLTGTPEIFEGDPEEAVIIMNDSNSGVVDDVIRTLRKFAAAE